ncbi:hypothetical protein TGAM01_v209974 [Trichoderma gamsii]|uniref:Uncharacterized protein n=1 Tax=Trichoderma gamsii TaxID=398673 RepID=A0A2P4ZA41_9HYPO|nr:hypothetical protein TGAM01_v209974 [Trichoderma gamsii]PON21126.1 hypothetical protein TGAM01_v209974 [Trichoderma gamsii]
MYCLEHCFHVVPTQKLELEDVTPILNHCEVSYRGYNFYFCAVHQAYHCMFLEPNLDQPLRGECAVFYYCLNVVLDEDYDKPAEPPAPEGSYRNAIANRLIDMDPWIQASHDVDNPQHLPPPVADAGLGEVRLYNPRQGLARLCFRSPTGAIGWMPCGPDIGRRAEFIHLTEHERDGDPVFKRIRLWACKMQGYYYMPKDIRWCLWAMYVLCTEALYNNRDADEAENWVISDLVTSLCVMLRMLFHVLQLPVLHPISALDWRDRRLQPS